MTPAFSPEQVTALGHALDQLVEKYGPFSEEEKTAVAEKLLELAQQGIWDVDQLVEMATPVSKRN